MHWLNCLVASFLDMFRKEDRFPWRIAAVLLAFLVTVSTCAFKERLALIRTPRYFTFLVCPSYLPWMVWLTSIGFLFIGDPNYLAFVWVEWHRPVLFPLL